MVVLADEILESFFETDLSASFKLEHIPGIELPDTSPGLLGGIWSAVATADNKAFFHRFTDELGKTIGTHQVTHRPSIGRYTKLEEPKARESLLTPAMRHSASKTSLRSVEGESTTSLGASSSGTSVATPTGQAPQAPGTPQKPLPEEPPEFSPNQMVQAANAALMERTPFAIDDAGDEDDEEEDDEEEEDEVMDEASVIPPLFIHEANCWEQFCRWTPSWRRTTLG